MALRHAVIALALVQLIAFAVSAQEPAEVGRASGGGLANPGPALLLRLGLAAGVANAIRRCRAAAACNRERDWRERQREHRLAPGLLGVLPSRAPARALDDRRRR